MYVVNSLRICIFLPYANKHQHTEFGIQRALQTRTCKTQHTFGCEKKEKSTQTGLYNKEIYCFT